MLHQYYNSVVMTHNPAEFRVPILKKTKCKRAKPKVLRYGLERPVGIRIWDHLDGFRMIRLAFYIWESKEVDRRHVPPISEAIPGSVWWKRIKLHLYEGTKVSTLRGPAQLADLQGALCVPHL